MIDFLKIHCSRSEPILVYCAYESPAGLDLVTYVGTQEFVLLRSSQGCANGAYGLWFMIIILGFLLHVSVICSLNITE